MSEPVSLASLMTPSKTVSIDFPSCPGMAVDVCYLAREELLKLRKKCLTTKFNKKTHQPEEYLDEERFLSEFCKATIKGWSGFKFKYLNKFLLVEVSEFDPDSEFPYTQENAEILMKNSEIFDTWITETASTLENFTKNK